MLTLPDISLSQVLDVFKLLTETYPRYSDTPSRDAIEDTPHQKRQIHPPRTKIRLVLGLKTE